MAPVRKELPSRSRSESLDSLELKDNGPVTTSIARSASAYDIQYIGSAQLSAVSLGLDVNGHGQLPLFLRQNEKINKSTTQGKEWRSPLMDGMDSGGGRTATRCERASEQAVDFTFIPEMHMCDEASTATCTRRRRRRTVEGRSGIGTTKL